MKTKFIRLMLATIAIIMLGVSGATADVLGKYNVNGREDSYGFKGTLTFTSSTVCVIRLQYSDGDSVTVRGKLKTALKNTRNKQTSKFTWSIYGMSGGGTLTVQGTKGGYSAEFSYSGAGVSGRGSGTKKP